MKLINKKCVPCEGGIPSLTSKEIAEYMKQISKEWVLTDEKKISRNFAFVNYRHTIDFVNKVADLAEEEGHHPVMNVSYGKIHIEIWTHAIDGLSENDFILAAKIDNIQ
jgi:4a-hydroxytetrahydrobiopterin dehydratase